MAADASSLHGMDLVTLRLLLAARDEGNLARAAHREGIAVSAVSRRISEFEARFGVALFDRHDRGVTPTPDGAVFLDRIERAMGLLEAVGQDLKETRLGDRGHVRVRAHVTAMVSNAFPERIARFLARHPRIDVELEEGTSVDIVHAVRVGSCDLGLISGTVERQGLELIPWVEDELVAVVPGGHPLAASERLSFGQLMDQPFVSTQRDSALFALCSAHAAATDERLRVRAHAGSFATVRRLVAAGLGVSALPAASCPDDLGGRLAIRPLDEAWAVRPLMICVRSRQTLSAAARRLIEALLAPWEGEAAR